MTHWKTWLRFFTGRSRWEADMNKELQSHIDMYVEELVEGGLNRSEAERRARMEFGTVEAIKEECREASWLHFADEVKRNVQYALRMLARSPTFAAAAILTLGVTIGANTAIFSVVDTVLLRPLPYPEPERLAQIVTSIERNGASFEQMSQTGQVWQTVKDHATHLTTAAFSGVSTAVGLVSQNNVRQVQQQRASAEFFRVLGVEPMLGRAFNSQEDQPGGANVVILSYSLWTSAFQSDPSILGRDVLLRGEPHTVVGIMPHTFRTSIEADLWTPLRATTSGEGSGANYSIIARLHPDTTWLQVQSQFAGVSEEALAPLSIPSDMTARLELVPFKQVITDGSRKPLFIVWAAGALVLLIGCVNVASLLLARASERTHELATRAALGGGRATLIRQLLSESLVLAVFGGALGMVLGYFGVRKLESFLREGLHVWQEQGGLYIWQELSTDLRVLGVMVGATLCTSLFFGLYPAWHASRVDIRQALIEGASRGRVASRGRWPQRLFVIGEVAMSVMLLVGAGLLIKTFDNLRSLSPGFSPDDAWTASISLHDARYRTAESVNRLFEQSLSRIREMPGIELAAVSLRLPYERGLNIPFRIVENAESDGPTTLTNLSYVTEDYFESLAIPLIRGRRFDTRDRFNTKRVIIVNQAFAEKYLPDQAPLGLHIETGSESREIVGVVGDVNQRQSGWGNYGPIDRIPSAYIPARQTTDAFLELVHTWFAPSWIVRTTLPGSAVIDGFERSVKAVDPYLPFAGFSGMNDVMARSLAQQRIQATLLGLLAGIALFLAVIGVYGLVSRTVMERSREMGIRLALGATRIQSVGSAAWPGIALSILGVSAGSLMAIWSGRVLQGLIWDISPSDPSTIAVVALGLLLIASFASMIPALRLTRLEPYRTLREQ